MSLLIDMTDEQFLKKLTIPSTGEEKKVHEITVKELREVKNELKKSQEQRKKLETELMNERKKPAKTIERVVKDHSKINRLEQQLKVLNNSFQKLEEEKQPLEKRLSNTKKSAEDYHHL